jgi:hypothetical protein
LREPNLSKTNPCVSLLYSLAICFYALFRTRIIFLTLTRLVVVINFVNFSFSLFTPPLGDFHLVNKIRSYGSTRWTDHDVVRLMLRSVTVIDPHLVNLICENPRYTKMTPEEILEKFVSGRMMVKEARYVDDALNGPLPIYEPQPVALKATSSREALPSKVAQG